MLTSGVFRWKAVATRWSAVRLAAHETTTRSVTHLPRGNAKGDLRFALDWGRRDGGAPDPRKVTIHEDCSGYQICESYIRAMPLFLFEPDQRRFVRAFAIFAMACLWLVTR